MNNLVVMKFGGTSMGSAERIRVAAAICTEQKAQRPVLAVVSAMSGVTDLLLGAQSRFRVLRGDQAPLDISLNLPGRHDVLNALAAIGVASELKVPGDAIQRALAGFRGVGRRFQQYGDVKINGAAGSFSLVDDYGHHPAEIAATLDAARLAFPGRRLVLAFQPHRYTRTRDLFEAFVKVLASADVLLLAEVYAAGEAPIAAADGRALAEAVRGAARRSGFEPIFIEDVSAMPEAIRRAARAGDVVLTMGAGSIGNVAGQLG